MCKVMEGHVADYVADTLFRVTLNIRFRRRGETILDSTAKLVRRLLDGRGNWHGTPQLLQRIVVTGRRQLSIFYGKLG